MNGLAPEAATASPLASPVPIWPYRPETPATAARGCAFMLIDPKTTLQERSHRVGRTTT